MNTFSDTILRSHPGSNPTAKGMVQIYDNEQLASFFARFARVFARLAPYKKILMQQAHTLGLPLCRPFLLHYPDDPEARAVSDQFLLGDELIMAPVIATGKVASSRDVFLPRGSGVWSRIAFTNSSTAPTAQDFDCTATNVSCSIKGAKAVLGSPLVFILKGGVHYDILKDIGADVHDARVAGEDGGTVELAVAAHSR
jgi:hypothetical protein